MAYEVQRDRADTAETQADAERAARIAAETRAGAEQARADTAEARIRELEERLRQQGA